MKRFAFFVAILMIIGLCNVAYSMPEVVAEIATSNEQGCGYDWSFNPIWGAIEYHSKSCANSALDTGNPIFEPVCAGYDTDPADLCSSEDLGPAFGILNNDLLEGTDWYPYGPTPLYGYPFFTCVPPGSIECEVNSECPWQGAWGSTCDEKDGGTPLDNVIVMHKNCPECNYICKCDPSDTYTCSEDYEYPCPFCETGNPGTYVDCEIDAECITDDECEQPSDTCQERLCIDNICQEQQKAEGASCTTGLYCTVGETCDAAGVCQGGVANDCDDTKECTADSCDEVNDQCVNDAAPMQGTSCGSGSFCVSNGMCDNGLCVGDDPCDDSNSCTADSCDEVNDECVNDPAPMDGLACGPDWFCVLDGLCSSGFCVGDAKDCGDTEYCTENERCDEDNDECISDPKDCSDTEYCTVNEQCDEVNDECISDLRDCSSNNQPLIATCLYDPDAKPFTWDYRLLFISVCDEALDECPTAGPIAHTCADNDVTDGVVDYNSVTQMCGATCDEDTDCECPESYCEGSTFHSYPENGVCSSTSCVCDIGEGVGEPCELTLVPNYGGCIEGKVESFASLTINFPDVGYGLVATKDGKADFTRGQNVKTDFNAKANVGGQGEIECNGILGPCAGAVVTYSITNIDAGTEFITDKTASWNDAVLAWRDIQETDSRFACDKWYRIDGKISLMVDDEEKTAVNSIEFYVNCVPKIILQPMERKFALGDASGRLFDVLLINPFVADKTFELVVADAEYIDTLGIEFGNGQESQDVLVYGIDHFGDKHEDVSVWMTENARRAGSYYITILDNTHSVAKTGLVSIFAESISEFGLLQFLGLLASAGIFSLFLVNYRK